MYFRRAVSLYGGPFLPGEDGKIISIYREDIHSMYQMIRTHAAGRQRYDWRREEGEYCLLKIAL